MTARGLREKGPNCATGGRDTILPSAVGDFISSAANLPFWRQIHGPQLSPPVAAAAAAIDDPWLGFV